MLTLQPVRFPRPVAIPIWNDDYRDILARMKRDGSFEIEEIWLPHSDDGWQSFCRRHGTYGFWEHYRGGDWVNIPEPVRPVQRRGKHTTLAERLQAEHEAEQLRIRQAKEAEQDRLWAEEEQRRAEEEWRRAEEERRRRAAEAAAVQQAEIATARAHWARVNPSYAAQRYRNVRIDVAGWIDGQRLEAEKTYWVPQGIADRLVGTK